MIIWISCERAHTVYESPRHFAKIWVSEKQKKKTKNSQRLLNGGSAYKFCTPHCLLTACRFYKRRGSSFAHWLYARHGLWALRWDYMTVYLRCRKTNWRYRFDFGSVLALRIVSIIPLIMPYWEWKTKSENVSIYKVSKI